MALTVPTIDDSFVQCDVQVSSTDDGITIPITLTSTQVADWSDTDLTDKVAALKAAVAAFLTPGQDIQVRIVWMRQGFTTTVQTQEAVS